MQLYHKIAVRNNTLVYSIIFLQIF